MSFRAEGGTRSVQESDLGSLLSSIIWTFSTSSRALDKLFNLFGFRTLRLLELSLIERLFRR